MKERSKIYNSLQELAGGGSSKNSKKMQEGYSTIQYYIKDGKEKERSFKDYSLKGLTSQEKKSYYPIDTRNKVEQQTDDNLSDHYWAYAEEYGNEKVAKIEIRDNAIITPYRPAKIEEKNFMLKPEYTSKLLPYSETLRPVSRLDEKLKERNEAESKIEEKSVTIITPYMPEKIEPASIVKKDIESSDLTPQDIDLQKKITKTLSDEVLRLSKKFGNKKIDDENKKNLEELRENPYLWMKIKFSKDISELEKKIALTPIKREEDRLGNILNYIKRDFEEVESATERNIPLVLPENFHSLGLTHESSDDENLRRKLESIQPRSIVTFVGNGKSRSRTNRIVRIKDGIVYLYPTGQKNNNDNLEMTNVPLETLKDMIKEESARIIDGRIPRPNDRVLGAKKPTSKEVRDNKIYEIGDALLKGIDKVVIHGETIDQGRAKRYKLEDISENNKLKWEADLDTRGALLFLQEAGVDYNSTEMTFKGSKIANEEGQDLLYLDTGGEILDIKEKNGGTEVYIDHHQPEFSKTKTSATKLMYEVLIKNGMLEKEPWKDNLVRFITDVDNLTFVESPKYSIDFLKNKWAGSLFALYNHVPFTKLAQWFKESRDPFNPGFTEEELREIKATKRVEEKGKGGEKEVRNKEISLIQLIEEKKWEMNNEINIKIPFAIKKMEENGIKSETPELGKILYNTMDPQASADGKIHYNKLSYGFLIAKAMGYDSFVAYNEHSKKFFINNTTRDLTPIIEKLRQIVPGTITVRGVMILSPQELKDRENITREKFLEALSLKEELPPLSKSPPELQSMFEELMKGWERRQQEKNRLRQELKEIQEKLRMERQKAV